jgi:hypothetical protein
VSIASTVASISTIASIPSIASIPKTVASIPKAIASVPTIPIRSISIGHSNGHQGRESNLKIKLILRFFFSKKKVLLLNISD